MKRTFEIEFDSDFEANAEAVKLAEVLLPLFPRRFRIAEVPNHPTQDESDCDEQARRYYVAK